MGELEEEEQTESERVSELVLLRGYLDETTEDLERYQAMHASSRDKANGWILGVGNALMVNLRSLEQAQEEIGAIIADRNKFERERDEAHATLDRVSKLLAPRVVAMLSEALGAPD